MQYYRYQDILTFISQQRNLEMIYKPTQDLLQAYSTHLSGLQVDLLFLFTDDATHSPALAFQQGEALTWSETPGSDFPYELVYIDPSLFQLWKHEMEQE